MKNKILQKLLIVVVVATAFLYLYRCYKYKNNLAADYSVEKEEISENVIEENINTDSIEEKIINILLLGVDKQENASDTIMILSLNQKNRIIKLVSIMRDTYVYQGENMANKINYAYHYGGAKGSIDTVNAIFNLDISKYIKVDFEGLISIVDNLSGVEVDINETERKSINATCVKCVINNSGKVRLNGEQALAFSRIRKIDSDYERTQRQRKVMMGIFQGIKKVNAFQYLDIIYKLLKISETNLSLEEVFKIGNVVYKYDESGLSELRIPIDGTSWDSSSMPYHLNWDEEINKKALHDFIYG